MRLKLRVTARSGHPIGVIGSGSLSRLAEMPVPAPSSVIDALVEWRAGCMFKELQRQGADGVHCSCVLGRKNANVFEAFTDSFLLGLLIS